MLPRRKYGKRFANNGLPWNRAALMPAALRRCLGANCGQGLEQMVGIVSAMRAAVPDVPILVKRLKGL